MDGLIKNQLRVVGFISLTAIFSVALMGCPPPPTPNLSVGETEIAFGEASNETTFSIVNSGSGSLTWNVSADQDWISFDQTSGTNDATVSLAIDRANLGLGLHEATVTVTSSAGTQTFTVVVDVRATPGSVYWPFQVGNTWTFGTSTGIAETTLTVSSQIEKNGFTVWQLDVGNPSAGPFLAAAEATLFDASRGLESLRPAIDSIPLGRVFDKLTNPPLIKGGSSGEVLPSFWVALDDGWYVTFREGALDNLPGTGGFVPWDLLAKIPADLTYDLETGRSAVLAADIQVVVAALAEEVNALGPELIEYLSVDRRVEVIALLTAFGDAFADYSNESNLITRLVSVEATLASGADDVDALVRNVISIIENFGTDLELLAPAFAQQLENDLDRMVLVFLLRAFADEFRQTENNDIVLQDFGMLLGALTDGLADILNSVFATPQAYTPNDPDLAEFFAAISVFMEGLDDATLSDPVTTIDALATFIEASEPGGPASEEMKRILLDVLPLLKKLIVDAEGQSASDGDIENLGRFTTDLANFFATFSTDNPDDAVAAVLKVVTGALNDIITELIIIKPFADQLTADLEALQPAIENFTQADLAASSYRDAFKAFGEFFEGFDATNDDVIAESLGIVSRGGEQIMGLLDTLSVELQNVPTVETQGALSDFLPIQIGPLPPFDLEVFGVGDQTDTVAMQITVQSTDPPQDPRQIPYMILGRDLGPLYFFGQPLQHATVNGTVFGVAP